MWRWSYGFWIVWVVSSVFSTYVEVILKQLMTHWRCGGILHVCGGDPGVPTVKAETFTYSPRMWRWSYQQPQVQPTQPVFSTYVEVIPSAIFSLWRNCLYSPRMWRWSSTGLDKLFSIPVFSTYVEVILIASSCAILKPSILHVCGGDPQQAIQFYHTLEYSPRMWRWSYWVR